MSTKEADVLKDVTIVGDVLSELSKNLEEMLSSLKDTLSEAGIE